MNENNSDNATQRKLLQSLGHVRQRVAQLHDPLWYGIGQQFNTVAQAAHCSAAITEYLPHSANAAFTGFNYPQRKFINEIVHAKTALGDIDHLLYGNVHEKIHAIQYAFSAAVHADPFNAEVDLILCPRDAVLLKIRVEQDAYAKAGWLYSLDAQNNPVLRAITARSPLSADDFDTIRQGVRNEENFYELEETLRRSALYAAEKTSQWGKGAATIPAAESWASIQLHYYGGNEKIEGMMTTRLKAAAKTGRHIRFVRLNRDGFDKDNDILSLSAPFGPNTFGRDGVIYPEAAAYPALPPALEKKILELNRIAGITDESCLPTLAEALAEARKNPKAMLKQSRHAFPPVPARAAFRR